MSVVRKSLLLGALGMLLALYGLTYRGGIGVIDEATLLATTVNLAEEPTLALNNLYPALLPWGAPIPFGLADAPIYSRYGLGQSLLALPLYVAGRLLPFDGNFYLNGYVFAPSGSYFSALLLNSGTTLLATVAVFFIVRVLDYSPRVAALAALLYGLTTMAWPYAKTFFSGPTTAAALAWAAYFTIRYGKGGRMFDGMLSGLALAMAIILRPVSVLAVPVVFVYLLPDSLTSPAQIYETGPRLVATLWRRWAAPALFVLISISMQLGYNLYRSGRLLAFGYERGFRAAPFEAWLGFLVSPGRSVFLYNPVLLLVIPGLILLPRLVRREAALLLAISVGHVLVYGFWHEWHGGQSLGPRYLLPALPLLVVLIAPVIERARESGWRWPLIGLGLLGFFVQVYANLANVNDAFFESIGRDKLPMALFNWRISRSFFLNQWPAYMRHGIDSILLRQLPLDNPYLLAALYLVAVCVLGALLLWAVLRMPDEPVRGMPNV